jgi:type VI protein secretion system component Hcp
MIVARIYRKDPLTQSVTKGTVDIEGYRGDGWFPANSFSFGFQEKAKEEAKQPAPTKPTGGGGGTAQTARTQTAGSSEKKKDESFVKMNLSKEVDFATVSLMALHMEERSAKKGVDSGIHADVHVLSSVSIGDKRHIYAGVMVHLEGVRVEQWSIDGSGDERPTESVHLAYDKGAMGYQKTPDGKYIESLEYKGWNQKDNCPWTDYKFDDKYLVKISFSF